MEDEFNFLDWLRAQVKVDYYLELESVFLYGVESAFLYGVGFDTHTDGTSRREWESHHNFYCVDRCISKCRGPGRTIKGKVNTDLDVYICWRHLARRKRMYSRGPTIPPSG